VSAVELAVAVVIAVGLVGVLVPVLPGLVLVWAGLLVWATEVQTTTGWVVLGVATLVLAASQVAKYLLPGRRMRAAGVPDRTLVVGGLLGIVGFFVVPVVGLPLGFVLGVYLAERARLGVPGRAWTSTAHALKGVGLSILIELVAGLLVAVTWASVVLAT
jgi:uncharacterized protein YqgC (DUF456 family)